MYLTPNEDELKRIRGEAAIKQAAADKNKTSKKKTKK